MDFSWVFSPETLVAFLTLVALELVLGVDNVIFISILAGKLPQEQQQRAHHRHQPRRRHAHPAAILPFMDYQP